MAITLYSYWRSTAAYRVRLALNLKGLDYDTVTVDLTDAEHRRDGYATRNPQMLVPFLEDGRAGIAQSLAILEYLEDTHPEPPLYPEEPVQRAQVRAFAAAIACDVHPLNNLRVLNYLKGPLAADGDAVNTWYGHWIHEAFHALEKICSDGAYTFGDTITAADVCLVPQIYNARRFNIDLTPFPKLVAVDARCLELPAFAAAVPERQPDAPKP